MLRKIAGKAKAAMGMTGDFRQKWQAYRQANKQDRDKEAKRLWDELGEDLQRVMDAVGKDGDTEVLQAKVASGESILPRMTVCVVNGVAYAADGASGTRKASGVCTGAADVAGSIYWTPTGTVACRVKRGTGVETYGTLYQSATKGWLTNNPSEVGLAYVQPVGTFVQWVPNPLGGTTSEALVALTVGGSEGSDVVWGDIGGDIEDQTDLQAVLDTIPDLNDAFTPTLIPDGETFTVPADKQVLFAVPIEIDGGLIIEGALLEVVD